MLSERPICICCRRAPATPPEILQIVPEDIVRATRFLRVGFCDRCAARGCDGINPCRIGPKAMEVRTNFASIVHAGIVAAQLFERWLQTQGGRSIDSLSDAWTQLSSAYWCKIPSASGGKVVLEVLRIPAISGYQVRVRSLSAGITGTTVSEAWQYQARTLDEAYAECDTMYRKMVGSGIAPKAWDVDRKHPG
jgi:hypothetical protein